MSKQVKEVLQEQRIWHEDVTTRFQPQQGFEDLVFTSKTNRPIHESNIRSSIEYIVDRINAQNPTEKFERFTPHCIAKGMRPKTLQKLLGHNSLQMTMDLYCHVLDETLKEEMSIIAEMV